MANDKTNYAQGLTHLIKGNLGAGILAMPASFAHTGLVGAVVGLPILCLVSTYCVHILIRSSQVLESKSKNLQLNYANLARQSFELGPSWLSRFSNLIGLVVDTLLLVTQVGVCCVYIIFVVDNLTSILASYDIVISKTLAFLAIFPVILLLSFIRTLNRLAVSSLLANLFQAIGLALIVEYLSRDLNELDLSKRDHFRPLNEMALGFGSAMFAFEGISVILPVYSRMKKPKQMASSCGIVNVSFVVILLLYFVMGLLGYLKFGNKVRDSITLNLPAEPLYDAVRAMFAVSIILSYPLQFYVPNEIIWEWAKKNLLRPTKQELSVIRAIEVALPMGQHKLVVGTATGTAIDPAKQQQLAASASQIAQKLEPKVATDAKKGRATNAAATTNQTTKPVEHVTVAKPTGSQHKTNDSQPRHTIINQHHTHYNHANIIGIPDEPIPLRYEYYCRLIVVIITFTLAFSVPKLNLLMDLIGSFSGAALCLTIPATIHLAAFWNSKKGFGKTTMIVIDLFLIIASLAAGACGSLSSFISIVKSFS